MSSILDLLGSQLGSAEMKQLAAQIDAPHQQTASAVQAALPMLLGALQRNASTPGGADSLLSALDRNHDGSVLDDVAGFFGQAATGSDLQSLDHIFGGRKAPVADAVSRASGLGAGQVTQLLAQLAPLVLGALGRMRKTQGVDAGGLGDLLGGAMSQLHASNTGLGGLLGGLLDADGDGSIADHLLQKGLGGGSGGGLGGLLGGLLGGGK